MWPAEGAQIPLSIPFFAIPPPILLKEREHSFFTLAPNQVCIELTAICQSFPALRLQICNLFWCLPGIFNSNINTGIVSCKYIKCHRRPDSRYRLQPPSPDRHTGFEESDTHTYVFSLSLTFCSRPVEVCKEMIPAYSQLYFSLASTLGAEGDMQSPHI